MTRFQILHVDNDLVQKVDLQIGDNIINRSVPNGWDGGRSVIHAVTINVGPDHEMTITPVSPCYMKSSECLKWKLLKLGTAVPIKCGDICTLVSNKCCFKILSMSDSNEEYTLKRKANEVASSDILDKKFCSGEGDNLGRPSDAKVPNDNSDATEVNIEGNMNEDNLLHGITEVKMNDSEYKATHEFQGQSQLRVITNDADKFQNPNQIGTTSTASEEVASFKVASNLPSVSDDSKSITTQDVSTVSTRTRKLNVSPNVKRNIARREKCKYGAKCYRRNLEHKDRFSHPNDSDYDAPDNREECRYGKRCYCKNPQHKMEYKHSGKNIANAHGTQRRKQIQLQMSTDAFNKMEDSSAEESVAESVDESDYEPSSDFDTSGDDDTCSEKNESEWESDAVY